MTMTAIEELKLFFTSSNAIPTDRAWVRKELFDRVLADYELHERRVGMLINVIHAATTTAGITNDIPLDGPQALMFGEDLRRYLLEVKHVKREMSELYEAEVVPDDDQLKAWEDAL